MKTWISKYALITSIISIVLIILGPIIMAYFSSLKIIGLLLILVGYAISFYKTFYISDPKNDKEQPLPDPEPHTPISVPIETPTEPALRNVHYLVAPSSASQTSIPFPITVFIYHEPINFSNLRECYTQILNGNGSPLTIDRQYYDFNFICNLGSFISVMPETMGYNRFYAAAPRFAERQTKTTFFFSVLTSEKNHMILRQRYSNIVDFASDLERGFRDEDQVLTLKTFDKIIEQLEEDIKKDESFMRIYKSIFLNGNGNNARNSFSGSLF